MEKKWGELSPEKKLEERFKLWLSPQGVKFASPKAKKSYEQRVTRLIDVIQLREPDRVPVLLHAGFFPVYYAGITPETAMYDYDKLRSAWRKYVLDFELDAYGDPGPIGPGRVFGILDYKLYKWPGHGISPNASYQYVEDEYMKADEYDAFIQDPSDFWMRVYMPRIFGALEPFKKLLPLTDIFEMPITGPSLVPYGMPDVQDAFQALLEAGREAFKWMETIKECNEEAIESGLPVLGGGMAKAPFDTLGDTLRGTQGIIMDMYRQPDKLIEAMERITPLTIKGAVFSANASGRPVIFMPLHKGADGFMSDQQYKTFYWPTLKKVILGLIDEGLVPSLFAEGSYNTRLEIIKELPRGKVIWQFDQTDMIRAKEVLGDIACIMGNVPSSLLFTGTPKKVKDYCKKLIEVAGKGGGFILAEGAGIDEGRPDNRRTMMEAAKEYGVYK